MSYYIVIEKKRKRIIKFVKNYANSLIEMCCFPCAGEYDEVPTVAQICIPILFSCREWINNVKRDFHKNFIFETYCVSKQMYGRNINGIKCKKIFCQMCQFVTGERNM